MAEAAAQGCLPVVSDEVGSAEPLSDNACERFTDAAGMDGFEAAVRRAIERVEQDGPMLRERVAVAARSQFGLETQAQRLLGSLRAVVERRAVSAEQR